MNRTQNTSSKVQITLLLGALVAGALVTKVLPERLPLAAYVPQTETIPTTAVFKHANAAKSSRDASRDLTGIDVDVRRLAILRRVS